MDITWRASPAVLALDFTDSAILTALAIHDAIDQHGRADRNGPLAIMTPSYGSTSAGGP